MGFRTNPTKSEKLLSILSDHQWHATKELSRKIGHTFGEFIFYLRHDYRHHHVIERRKHPTKRYQHQYRLRDDLPF